TYQAIRESTGPDFPVFIKINVTDGFENGVSFDDVLYLCKELTQKGIDAIETSGNWSNVPKDSTSFFKNEAENIATKNETKVILTGGNKDFEEMSKILNSTKIEYFGMARALAKKPGLINEFKKCNYSVDQTQ
ncbi:MAG: hypothetical protein LBJ67_10090, partial [Planctomycetaceae bacterium]|nr:hypothetical protein [Planctomycetaceae bacterium]